ncbi:ANTAR domain-containing response regulator [Thermohalobacter berrensis]|uniref:Response regulator receiver protein n=1 Tax=Thermohalobacter berrensis TaxID=99594 RepID=A0A419SXV7_9FIRM|nr:ANTAR domain-containing protein [Thermohalobacter berrensis]RKD30064.1 response regulator receiver protein [Thermohalobacter berrensis]
MDRYKIVVADSSETSRKKIKGILAKRGYKVYEASDGAGAIRLTRSTKPDLVLIDTNIWGISSYDAAEIIEKDNLATVVFITSNPNKAFIDTIKNMSLFAYITKPIKPEQLYQIIDFALFNSSKIKNLQSRVEKLETKLSGRKLIDRAKGIIMEKFDMTENEAYKFLRKKSMDNCKPMEEVAKEIINND